METIKTNEINEQVSTEEVTNTAKKLDPWKDQKMIDSLLSESNTDSIAKLFKRLYKNLNEFKSKIELSETETISWLRFPYLDSVTINARKHDLIHSYWFNIETITPTFYHPDWRRWVKYSYIMLVKWLSHLEIERKKKEVIKKMKRINRNTRPDLFN